MQQQHWLWECSQDAALRIRQQQTRQPQLRPPQQIQQRLKPLQLRRRQTRPSSSGTRALFKNWALNGEEEASNEALETDDSGTLLQTVEQNKGAIGYVALSYLVNDDTVKTVSIDGVAPTLENTYNGTYKVWGFEHMYTNGEGSDAAQAFINYMMGDEFGESIEAMGYGVSSRMSDEAVKSHEAQ